MKLLTVTVPCYNSQDYMEKCIESLLRGGERVEIIVIDDGSRDATGEIGDRYAAQYPGIVKVIHQENGGHGAGINAGLKAATGKYFKVVDSDDEVSGDFVAFLDRLELCDQQGGVDLFVTNYYYVHTDGIGDRSINYSNEEILDLIDEAQGMIDFDARMAAYQKIDQAVVHDDAVTLPLYQRNHLFCLNPRVKGFKLAWNGRNDMSWYNISLEG